MRFGYSKKGEVKVDMKECIMKTIQDFSDKIGDGGTSPAADDLFQVDSGGKNLNEELGQAFHTTVARLLFVCKCTR
eukprot:11911756-Ditylum_brightwellii.AAC.1